MTAHLPPIFDGHNDTLLHIYDYERGQGRSFFRQSDMGHLDLPRAHLGRLAGGIFAIYVPPSPEKSPCGGITSPLTTLPDITGPISELPATTVSNTDSPTANVNINKTGNKTTPIPNEYAQPLDTFYARDMTIAMMSLLFRWERHSPDTFKVVRTPDELKYCLEHQIFAAVLHIEGADAIDIKLHALDVFYQAGLRSLGITWSRPNAFGYGVTNNPEGSPDTGPGLTEAGKRLIRRCNDLGIMLDLSHLNEKGFWDVAKISHAPLVATHSCVHHLCPVPRNLLDSQLQAIARSRGLVGINFCRSFLCNNNSHTPASITDIVRHIRYIADKFGIEHVALGSDFDGADIPADLHDAAGLPKLLQALQENGFNYQEIEKIAYRNWLRVLAETWQDKQITAKRP